MIKHKTWWFWSTGISLALFIVLVFLWAKMNQYEVAPTQLVDQAATHEYLNEHWEQVRPEGGAPTIHIKTGIFIQSLKFFNSSEVNLTGYVWQKYRDGIHDAIKPQPSEIGFILPEQIDTGAMEPQEIYRVRQGDEELIGWYFEATLRQPFKYTYYPFDHKTVWVRMWPKAFSENVVLVPDFAGYKATGLEDIFGIEKTIVLGAWERQNTYFDYQLSSYDTDFGIDNYVGQLGFPELHYNFVVKRKFENAFIIYLLPLFVVAVLLFAALLTVSAKEDLSNKLGFSVTGFIGASSALFFVVMLAHIQLREQFGGTSVVYIEYFYILMYAVLAGATANTFLFSIGSPIFRNVILYNDNIIPKIAYWPLVFFSMIIITLMVQITGVR